MLKKATLTTHAFILYGFMALPIVLLAFFSTLTLDGMIASFESLHREDLPLARIMGDISRRQLEQAIQFNTLLLYASTGDRERFEIANERFVQSGKQITDAILEGRNVARKGMDDVNDDKRRKAIERVKTILTETDKIHSDYEHLGATLIRAIYQFEFLTRVSANSRDQLAMEEANKKHLLFVQETVSKLEDETKRLDDGLIKAMAQIKTLAGMTLPDVVSTRRNVFNVLISIIFFTLMGGMLLVFAIRKIHTQRTQERSLALRHSTSELGAHITPLRQATLLMEESALTLDGTTQQSGQTLLHMRHELTRLLTTLEEQIHSASLATRWVEDGSHTLRHLLLLTDKLHAASGSSLHAMVTTRKNLDTLTEHLRKIHLLAASTTVEAARSQQQELLLLAQEIKHLAEKTEPLANTTTFSNDEGVTQLHTIVNHAHNIREYFAFAQQTFQHTAPLVATTSTLARKHQEVVNGLLVQSSAAHALSESTASHLKQTASTRATLLAQADAAYQILESFPEFTTAIPLQEG